MLNRDGHAEVLPEFARKNMNKYLVNAHDAISKFADDGEFQSEDDGDGISNIMQLLQDNDVDCDTPCFNDELEGVASFIEVLVDKNYSSEELIQLLQNWQFAQEHHHLTLVDRLNFITDRLDNILANGIYEGIEEDKTEVYESHIKARKQAIEQLKAKLPASG